MLPVDPVTGASQTTRDQATPGPIECGGGCLASTAADYLTFAQMLLNGGSFGATRVLGPKTVEYMTSDATGPDIDLSRLYLMSSLPLYGHGYGLGGPCGAETGSAEPWARRAAASGPAPGGRFLWAPFAFEDDVYATATSGFYALR